MRILRRLTVLAIAVLTAASAAAAATISRQPAAETHEGRYEKLVADDFEHGTSREEHHLVTDTGERLVLLFADAAPADWRTGDRVRVTGRLDAKELRVERQERVRRANPERIARTQAVHTVLLIRYNFADDTSQPYSDSAATATMFGASGSVAAFYSEGSYGSVGQTGAITPWLTVSAIKPVTCDTSSSSQAYTLAASAGFNPGSYNYVVYVFPHIPCGWAGLGVVGGSGAWINQALSTYVTAHELGHNYGLWHSHSLDCGATAWGTTCVRSEYGDPFDTMGGNLRQFNSYSKADLGWLTPGNYTSLGAGGGTYVLQPFESYSGLRAIRLTPDTGRVYWIENRQSIGFDGGIGTNGVLVRIGPSQVLGSDLLDMTPDGSTGNATFGDAALAVGSSWTDPESSLTVTTVSNSSGQVTVNIQYGTTPPTPHFSNSASPRATLPVTFTDTTTGQPVLWSWDFGDGGSSTVRNATHTFALPGTYQVKDTVTNIAGSASLTQPITVAANGPAPTITTLSPPGGPTMGGTTVTINGTNFGSTVALTWNGSALPVTSHTATQIVANAPAHAAGAVTVAVTAAGGTATKPSAYTYNLPAARVFVGPTGNDANDCSTVTTPCHTYAGALAQVAAGGEIIVRASGSYGGASIGMAVTIEVPRGVVAFSGQPIIVSAGPADVVSLKGLTIQTLPAGASNGIDFLSGAALHVEGGLIDGAAYGINAVAPGRLFVSDTAVRNSTLGGILVGNSAAPGQRAVIEHCRLEGNAIGLLVLSQGNSVASVRDTVATGNATGLKATAFGAGSFAALEIENCLVSNNTVAGVAAAGTSGGVGTVQIGSSTVTHNAAGLQQAGAGVLLSRGDNTIEGNAADTSGTIGTVAPR